MELKTMLESIEVDQVKNITAEVRSLSEIGFLFIFSISTVIGIVIAARYFARLFEQKERQIEAEHKTVMQLFKSNMEIIQSNTDASKELSLRLTELVQEARHNHKEIMTHLTIVATNSAHASKQLYQQSLRKEAL
jgi:uncharacterized membrane protein